MQPEEGQTEYPYSGFWFLISSFWCADLADAIPELLRLADLEVRIPRLEILALERLADRDGKSVDAVLARELLDVVSPRTPTTWPPRSRASPPRFGGCIRSRETKVRPRG